MGRRFRSLVCVALAAAGCSSDPPTDVVVRPRGDAGALDATLDSGLDAADGSDVATGDAGDALLDAGVPSVFVGLHPTTAAARDGGTSRTALTEAVLVSLAAGANALVLDRDWGQLQVGEASKEDWGQLGALSSYLSEAQKQLLFMAAAVNSTVDSRPASLHGDAWNGAATLQATKALIDRVFATFGGELVYLSLGMDVDQYLSSHPSEATSFVAYMTETLKYARGHADRPPRTEVGLTWSSKAWEAAAPWGGHRDTLIEASDTVMLSLYGLNSANRAAAPDETVEQLRLAVESLEERRIVIHRAAYTTSPLLGASELAQATFVSALFEMVENNRERFPFVGVAMLNDPAPEECLRFAQARNSSASTEGYAFWCSTGLRTRFGVDKAAFSVFGVMASGLSSP